MRSILSIAFLSAFLGIKAQNNMVVFSENGEKFFLIVNGVKQNIEAETNVKVTDLIQPQYKVKVVFEDKTKGVVDQNIFLMDGGEQVKNYEFVYSVKMTKKASYKIRPVSAVSTSQVKADPSQTVVHYSTTEPTPSNNNVISEGTDVSTSTQVNNNGMNTSTNMGGTNMNTNVQVTETKTQTQTNNGGANGANVGVNIGGMGVNININDNTGGMGSSNTTVTSQTVTTTTSSSSSGNVQTNTSSNVNMSGPSKPKSTTTTSPGKPKYDPLPGYTGAVGCTMPINSTEFASVKKTIDTKNFEDSKIKIAKQVIDNNCLLSSQVKEIMMLFNFEETRLDLAKYAYGHTYDIGNYYKLNDAFKFEASIDELDEYIKSQKSTK